jgi:hypothetical protein
MTSSKNTSTAETPSPNQQSPRMPTPEEEKKAPTYSRKEAEQAECEQQGNHEDREAHHRKAQNGSRKQYRTEENIQCRQACTYGRQYRRKQKNI